MSLFEFVTVMWFDGPLFAGQAVFGTVGALHIPIIAAGVVIAMLLIVMLVRYSTM